MSRKTGKTKPVTSNRVVKSVNENDSNAPPNWFKANWLIVLIIGFLSLGALGAGPKYLEDDAKRELARRESQKGKLISDKDKSEESFLNRVNPFLPAPLPSPTPQLSKEYIYAGSKLLAVEDANATAAPPADLAIWRSSSGEWWIMGQAGSQQTTQAWGTSGDKPVPGDYDGDGKTDFSVFRPSNGNWYFIYSAGGGGQIPFGISGDEAAQADYDGDGRTDAAIFRPSTGTWYVSRSSDSGTTQQPFGLSTDTPAPADYDGDGRADIAVWRNSNATFYILRSSNNQTQIIAFGQTNDAPVSTDYDGDGKADVALKRGNLWLILNSSNNQTQSITWEQASDLPVQNDYDGDGKVDIAVWRNSNGNWYIRKSGSNGALRQEQWGISGDYPVPAYYRR